MGDFGGLPRTSRAGIGRIVIETLLTLTKLIWATGSSLPPPDKALQLTSAGDGVLGQRRPALASLAGRLLPSGGAAPWATLPVNGARS